MGIGRALSLDRATPAHGGGPERPRTRTGRGLRGPAGV